MKTTRAASLSLLALVAAASFTSLAGCSATTHDTTLATFPPVTAAASIESLVEQPGPVTVRTVTSAEWEVPRSGLINLENPEAKKAGLTDGSEPIKLFVHVVHHPTRGTYVIDTGVERAFTADRDHALIHGFFAHAAHTEKLVVHTDMEAILASEPAPIQGVFLTHLHLDHVLGMRNLPAATPVYVGAGDAEDTSLMNVLERGVYDDALDGKGPLREVHFAADPDRQFEGVLDVFGDGSLWAISVPGHTPGSTAFLARTPAGPVLLTGDACHSAWGWDHGVEPGTFSDDIAKSAESLARLERFVRRHPRIDVRLGHQSRTGAAQ